MCSYYSENDFNFKMKWCGLTTLNVDHVLSARRAAQCWLLQQARTVLRSLRGMQAPLGHLHFCSSPKSSSCSGKIPTGTHISMLQQGSLEKGIVQQCWGCVRPTFCRWSHLFCSGTKPLSLFLSHPCSSS